MNRAAFCTLHAETTQAVVASLTVYVHHSSCYEVRSAGTSVVLQHCLVVCETVRGARNTLSNIHSLLRLCLAPLPILCPGIFPETHFSRKEGIRVKLLHLGHQVICGECHILHKLPVKQEPIRATVHSNALWDPPVPQAPHMCITLQEKTIQALFPNEPVQNKLTLSTWVTKIFESPKTPSWQSRHLLSTFCVLIGARISCGAYSSRASQGIAYMGQGWPLPSWIEEPLEAREPSATTQQLTQM